MSRAIPALLLICAAVMPAFAQDFLRPVMPPRIFAAPGVEMNVYFDNVLLHPRSDTLVYDVDCPLGAQQQERWTATPAVGDVGEHMLTLRVLTAEMDVIEEATTTVEVVDPAAGEGREIAVLCIGDSLTAASQYTQRLVELFAEDEAVELTLIGEAGPGGDTGNRHEGYGGWSFGRFVTAWDTEDYREIDGRQRRVRSPFVFEIDAAPRLDFQRYLNANNGGEPPDFITILLGCNDTFSADEETIDERIDAMFEHATALIAAIRIAAPETPIGLLALVPPAASQDAFGANYRSGQTRWQYRRNQHRVVEREYEAWSGRADEGLFLIPAHLNLDTVWGFPRVNVPANAYAQTTVSRMSNGVHPGPAGYYQIGDSIYCWLKSRQAD
ncbi:MAG: SGNH/GDSL hydrolase family protein [Armatimonadota bacterium]|jgi:lysophospholipase L1-like esterase